MPEQTPQKAREMRDSRVPKIQWDDSQMKSTYSNACNVTSTREEVVLFFGISHPASGGEGGQAEVKIQLSDRIIVSPFAAKRLLRMLSEVVEQYESRFGSLDPETGVGPATKATGS